MKKKLLLLTGCIYLSTTAGLYAQGVTFTDGLSWKQILAKAQKENKLIFADCYTTWCGPCKQMEKEVYPKESVGAVVNQNFVSIKIQMDSTKMDSKQTKAWYSQARKIRESHKVTAFPSYLIFSYTGDIVYREQGAQKEEKFKILMQQAADTGIVYAQQLKEWKSGKKDYKIVPSMIQKAEAARDNETAGLLARDCIEKYIPSLPEFSLYNKELLVAIGAYIQPGDKKLFSLFYPKENGLKTDSLINRKGTSKAISTRVIEKEIQSMLIKNDDFTKPIIKKPDWHKLQQMITEKYDAENADNLINRTKENWYRITQPNWNELAKAQIYRIKKQNTYTGDFNRMNINNTLWYDIFFHVEDTSLLAEAVGIMKQLLDAEKKEKDKIGSGNIDTYSNLLFKLGRKEEAIAWQQKAIALRPEVKEFKETLEKMQKGIPTWLATQ